ncbi:ion transporter [Nocardia otitidiscaviarum]|uniref:hypothetical protein n=1 Tax=Nocardia otitidiscaviarum TaxID=1823 RepID=UPI001893DB10|nr:hypothetical protein [Nocardia otitidiscaviarum]MBF6181340.1 hypothetical protein [Nocardia otitidiscaviarum]
MTEPRSAQPGGGGGADQERQDWAEGLVARLDGPMSALGVLFLFVVLGQTLARSPVLITFLAVLAWGLWLIFAGEFLLRLYVAPRRGRFLRKHWWQVLFLALPFLRFLRLVRLVRFARAGGVVSSAVRGSRSAGRLLSSRVGWLAALTAVVVLAGSQLVVVTGDYHDYATALHDVGFATVTGEPMTGGGALVRVLEVVLAAYSVVVFATLAASLGAYFLRRDTDAHPGPAAPDRVGEFTPDTRVSGRTVRASGLHERKPGPGRRNGPRRHAEFDGKPGP